MEWLVKILREPRNSLGDERRVTSDDYQMPEPVDDFPRGLGDCAQQTKVFNCRIVTCFYRISSKSDKSSERAQVSSNL